MIEILYEDKKLKAKYNGKVYTIEEMKEHLKKSYSANGHFRKEIISFALPPEAYFRALKISKEMEEIMENGLEAKLKKRNL